MDQGVIRRKLAAAQRDGQAPPVIGGAERALPLALARAARDGFGMALDCAAVTAQRYSLPELLDLPPDRALILLLEGPRAAFGLLVLDADMLAGLIEAQTLGRVLTQPALSRKPTRTDAAMVADWVDAVMADLEDQLLTEEDLIWTDGFRYSSHLDDPRPLALMLDDTAYKVLSVTVNLAEGREGRLVLALPADGHGRRPQRSVQAQRPDPAEGLRFAADLAGQVLEAEVVVQGVLTRLTLPLSALLALKVGDLLPLPQAALDRIDLAGMDGRSRGQGRLGQARGQRALRMTLCGDPGGRHGTAEKAGDKTAEKSGTSAVPSAQPDPPGALPLAG